MARILTNDVPTAVADGYSVLASGPTTVSAANGVLANDADAEDALTAMQVTGPAHGALTLNADGSFVYTPGAGFSGTDSFTYEAFDGARYSAAATVTLTTAPVAAADFYQTAHDAALTVGAADGVLAGASDAAGAPMTAVLAGGPAHGLLTFNADGSFAYTPAAGYVGNDAFTYVVQARGQTSVPTTATISVTDQAPDAPDDSFQVHAGDTLTESGQGLKEVATDPDFDPLTFGLVSGPAHGTLTLKGDGTFVYRPDAGFVGTDAFTYRAFDGALYSANGTVTITVEDIKPTAAPASFDLAANGSLTTGAAQSLLNASFHPEGRALAAVLVAAPQHAAAQAGSFTLNPDGTFAYTPAQGFTGPDAFTYAVTDGALTSDPVTVSLNVTTTPAAHNDSYLLRADGSLTVDAAAGVLANDFNPNPGGGPLTAQLVAGVDPSVGSLTLNADGGFTFSVNPNRPPSQGPITFGYNAVAPGVGAAGAGAAGPLQGLVSLWLASQTPAAVLTEVDYKDALHLLHDTSNFGEEFSKRWTSDKVVTTGLLAGLDGNDPIAYVQGQAATLQLRIAVGDPTLYKDKNVQVVGVANTADIPPIVGTATLSGDVLVVKDAAMQLPNKAEVLDGFGITWYVLPPGAVYNAKLSLAAQSGDWVQAGTSHDRLYVTYQAPVKGTKLYETVVRVGTQAAAGATSADDVTQAVVAKFQTRHIAQPGFAGPAAVEALAPALTYYDDWSAAEDKERTTKKLLQTGDGDCQAWTKCFLDVLKAQGIGFEKPVYDLAPSNPVDNTLYVKNWQAPVDPKTKQPIANSDPVAQAKGYPYLNTSLTEEPWHKDRTTGEQRGYDWATAYVTQGDPLPAQGNADPAADFPNHEIAQITLGGKTFLFDPSYGSVLYGGATDADRLLAFQKGAIDMFGRTFFDPADKKWHMLIRPASTDTLQLESVAKKY